MGASRERIAQLKAELQAYDEQHFDPYGVVKGGSFMRLTEEAAEAYLIHLVTLMDRVDRRLMNQGLYTKNLITACVATEDESHGQEVY